jgi:hypothetical protein
MTEFLEEAGIFVGIGLRFFLKKFEESTSEDPVEFLQQRGVLHRFTRDVER